MTPIYTIPELQNAISSAAKGYCEYCRSLTDEEFFGQPPEGKWSPAQQTRHLITSTRMAGLALRLPKFMVRIIAGKPNRPSRTYDELVNRYRTKLAEGGKASGRYVPKPISPGIGKEKLIGKFESAMDRFADQTGNQEEKSIDSYLAPHPLLGKISLRELIFFTIHHTDHHLENVSRMLAG